MAYFLVRSGEDGTSVTSLSEKTLLKRIEPDNDGEYYYGYPLRFLNAIPEEDKGCWCTDEDAAVLIKGEIIVPKAKKVVKRYDLE